MRRWLLFSAAGVMACSAIGCRDDKALDQAKRTAAVVTDRTPLVTLADPKVQTIVDKLEITGDITTGADSTIGAKVNGKLTAVFVKEGDKVTAGQLLATQDTTQLQAQMRQAQALVATASAGLTSAVASLSQARRNFAAGPAKSTATLRSAQAALRSAQAQRAKAKAGSRPEEVRQLELSVVTAQKDLDVQTKELQRVQTLVAEGALAGNTLDRQQNLVVAAQSRLDSAQQQLILAKAGARSEDIETANEQVRQAQEQVNTAQVQKGLDPLLKDQVDAAQAQVASAKSQMVAAQANTQVIQQQIEDTQIRAPFSGRVVGKPAQPGVIAGAGTSIVRIIGGSGAYFNGSVPATVVDQLRPGQTVAITVDGMNGQSFNGTIESVSPIGESVGRLFTAKVLFGMAPESVRPGMFAHGLVQLRTIQNAMLVPGISVVDRKGQKSVFTVRDDKAVSHSVILGIEQGDLVQVTGLPAGEKIVVAGQNGLSDGVKVKVDTAKTDDKKE